MDGLKMEFPIHEGTAVKLVRYERDTIFAPWHLAAVTVVIPSTAGQNDKNIRPDGTYVQPQVIMPDMPINPDPAQMWGQEHGGLGSK